MDETRQDTSELYDADFINSQDEAQGAAQDEADAFEKKSGFFSRHRRKKARDADGEPESSGYDIFQLEQMRDEKDNLDDRLGDINALLESVGISPIDEKPSSDSAGSDGGDSPQQDEAAQSKEVPAQADGKTRSFDLSRLKSQKSGESKAGDKAEKEAHGPAADESGQLILDGYEDEPAVQRVSEQQIEQQLKTSRKRLIESFRVLADDRNDAAILEKTGKMPADSLPDVVEVTDGEDIFDAVDRAKKRRKGSGLLKKGENVFRAAMQRTVRQRKKQELLSARALKKKTAGELKKTKLSLILCAAALAVSLVLAFVVQSFSDFPALDPLVSNGARLYCALELLLLFCGLVIMRESAMEGLDKIRQFKIDHNCTVLLLCLFVLFHTVVMLFTGFSGEQEIVLYAPSALLGLLSLAASKYLRLSTIGLVLDSTVKADRLVGAAQVENSADAAALGHGITGSSAPSIIYTHETTMPEDIEQAADSAVSSERFYSICSLAVMLGAVILSAAASLIHKNSGAFTAALVCTVCLCLPAMRRVVLELVRFRLNKKISREKAAVWSFDACAAVGKADAVAFCASDIFDGYVSKFRMVPGARMALSDAVVYAAGVLKNTGCLIADAFDDFIEQSGIKLPAAQDVQYEERLGYAGWVAGRRVLVGNREMLAAHSVDAPSKQEEAAYAKNKSVMYVAVEGIICATFIVSYKVKKSIRRQALYFGSTGSVLMVSSLDPCLDERFIASRLSIVQSAVKLTDTKGTQILQQYRSDRKARSGSGLLAADNPGGALGLINAAKQMYLAEKSVTAVNITFAAVGFILMALLAALGAHDHVNALSAVSFQIGSAAATFIVCERISKR